MPENIETKVAQTILQQPEEITVGDKVYKAAPPSAATLILASEAVARMPKIQLNTERIVDEVLAIGKDCPSYGRNRRHYDTRRKRINRDTKDRQNG